VTINQDTAIRFLNAQNEAQSVTEWDQVWGSGTMHPGDHFTRYFRDTGTWHYYSTYGDRNIFEGSILVE
jgi:plastocyanin